MTNPQDPLASEEHGRPCIDRRRRLMEMTTAPILVRGDDNPNFRYLTGLAEPRGSLLLAPEGVRIVRGRKDPGRDYLRGAQARQVLFLPREDPLAARWGEQGPATVESVDAARRGFDLVLPAEELETVAAQVVNRTQRLAVVRRASPVLSGADDAETLFLARLRRRFVGARVEDLTGAVHEMRRIKDPAEVERIEAAIAVTAEGLSAVAAALKPGLREYELEAELARTYRAHGATHAFEPIVAAGANALKLHYRDNRGEVPASGLLLVDTGACVDGYRADITRTFPVAGRFDDRQREVYEAVLVAQERAIAACRPGTTLGDLHAVAWDAIEEAGFGSAFVHGIGHHLGIETHDVGDIHAPLEPGAVITVEPGVYLEEEGTGVRIEDDILVTRDGPRCLSRAIPRGVEEIEALLAGSSR